MKSLQFKFTAMTVLVTITALVVASAAMVTYNLHDYRERVTADLNVQAGLLARAVTPALHFFDRESADSYLSYLDAQSAILEAAIYDANGALFSHFRVSNNEDIDIDALGWEGKKRIEGETVAVYKKIVSDGELVGVIYLKMQYQFVAKLIGSIVIASLAIAMSLLVAVFFSVYTQRKVTGPILEITELAQKFVETKDYSLRARKLSHDEIGILVDAFNNLLQDIADRTKALEASNNELVLEIEERIAATEALAASEDEVKQLNASLEARVRDRTTQLEATNRELEAFSYSVSHDLRSPLRAIDGFSQALLEDYADKLDSAGKDYLARVRGAAQKMGTLIDDMLKLSRVTRSELHPQSVDVSEMVRGIVRELSDADPKRQVKISVAADVFASADAHLLRIALSNLVSNAWKYTGKCTAPSIEFGTTLENGETVYFVRDNGAGFDMAHAGKLFGAFQRLHAANDFPGNGIGLATVQRAINRHGGRLWAEAKPQEGATFYFTLPIGEDYEDLKAG